MSECQCALAGWCEKYQRLQTQRNLDVCQDRAKGLTPEQCSSYRASWAALLKAREKEPGLVEKAGGILLAGITWQAAGRPVRQPEEIVAITTICAGCEKFRGGTCTVCGCLLRYKIPMATEHCPEGKW